MAARLIPPVACVLALACFALAGAGAPAPTTQPQTRPSTRPTTSAQSLTADQMLSQMLRPPPSGTGARVLDAPADPPLNDKTSGGGAVKPNAPTVTVMREGTFLADRMGRLTRSADGSRAEFTFEADGAALRDPPLIILPNLKLMAMEDAIKSQSRDLRFRVTGMVTEYGGRNYILLEKVVVVPDAAQQGL